MDEQDIVQLFSLRGKTAIITGGAGMLGQQYAKILKSAGANVVVFDIEGDMKVDVSNKEEVTKAVQKVVEQYGSIDVLINNAALNPVPGTTQSETQFAPYEDYPKELWESELKINLSGMMFPTQAVVPFMKKQQSGSIINISSTYGNVGPDNRIYNEKKSKSIGYATTKGAVLNFTRAWASYLEGSGIRVNTLTPGGVEAGQSQDFINAYKTKTILGRMAKKDEYNGAILFLASDASSYMTGANLVVDGGWTAW